MITARSQPQLSQLLFRIIIILCRKFELLKTDPEDNVPADQSHAACSESSVECHQSFMLGCLSSTVHHSSVSSSATVHKPKKMFSFSINKSRRPGGCDLVNFVV